MQKRSYIKIFGLLVMLGTSIMIGLAVFLPRLIDINEYRDEIIQTLEQSLNRKVSFSGGRFKMQIGPTFVFDDVVVKEPDGSSDFITAKHISVHLAVLPLLEKRVVLRDLILDGTRIQISRASDGKLSIHDLLKPQPDSFQLQLRKVRVKNGALLWEDAAIQKKPLKFQVSKINMTLEKMSRGHKGHFDISAELPGPNGPAAIVTLSGTAKIPPASKSLKETELNAVCDLKHVEPGRFWPYFAAYIPFGNTGGQLDISSSFKGKLAEFSAKGKLRLAGVSVVWPSIFHHPVDPRLAELDYEFKLNRDSIEMPRLSFSADGFKIKGSCNLLDIRSKDMRITARASSEPFILENLRQWIPYGIIAKDASEYIEEHITGGIFRLDNGSLDGRVSQIVHMEKGTNYNVLHIKGVVDKGIVSYGSKVPQFANIKAGLEMAGKDFILSRVTATFGGSPFKMEGRITDYPLDTPCQYPFQMEIVPRGAEVAWLAKLVRADKLEFSGNSRLLLKGSGFIPSYRLSGDWELKQAAYNFPDAVKKSVGMANHLSFSAVLGPSDTRLTSLSYALAPLNLSASAHFRHGARPNLDFEVQTNQFLLGDTLPILTLWQQYRLRGKVQAHIMGSGSPEDFSAMNYSGSIALNAFSLQPGEPLKAVSNINGTVNFKGNSLETSRMNVIYGSSRVNVRGRIKNLSHPEAEIFLSSPEFFMRDVAVSVSRPESAVRDLKAKITIHDDLYTFRGFSGRFNATQFSANGTYMGGAKPRANLVVTSRNLDLDDLLLLSRMEFKGDKGKGGSKADVKVRLMADKGNYDKLLFKGLNARLSQDNGAFYVTALEAAIYGGILTAKGRVDQAGGNGSRFDLNFSLDKVNAEQLTKALDITREVTGTLSLSGELNARGGSFADVKKTAQGTLKLGLENGKLRKFGVLSKLFSILNVSQLLKFQLPDMVSGGMPYEEITGSFAVRDGTVSTQDLFISGDAINISIIGSADIVKEELNFNIGVQPLQTVDKIVNRIPVVGWLLTGKGDDFLTAYFEAKGKWSDPQVKPIQVKSMASGVLNVFRRVFELPVRLFTDTGEVILGQ